MTKGAARRWRALAEDEWGFVPELPRQGKWLPEAEPEGRLYAHMALGEQLIAM